MSLTTLPYPNMDFVPLDILTADELDHMVANIEAINSVNVIDKIGEGSITTEKIANGSVTPYKITSATYSTAEKEIGFWVDGSKVYRKVFVLSSSTSTTVTVNHGIGSLPKIINAYGYAYMKNSSSQIQPIPRVVPDAEAQWGIGLGDVTSSLIRVIWGTSYGGITSGYLVIEYTK